MVLDMFKNRSFFQIMKKELLSFFISPIAYIVIAVFLIVIGVFYFLSFFINDQAQLRSLFAMLPLFFSFLIPAITMKLFAEERNTGSFELLTTLPVKTIEIVIGKVLASTVLVVVMLIPTLSYVFTVIALGNVDMGPIFSGYLGAILLAGAFSSIGVLASSLTKNQIISYLIAVTLCILLTIISDIAAFLPNYLGGFVRNISSSYHFKNFARGIIDTRDLIYFVSLMVISVLCTTKIIEERR